MLVEQRTYTCAPGKVREYLQLYQDFGVQVHAEILGHWLGCYVTEAGPLNQVVHLWGFSSFEDRLRRRSQLAADPRWRDYLVRAAGIVVQQESKLLLPAPFTPVPPAQSPSVQGPST